MSKVLVVTNNLDAGLGITEWIRHYYNALVLRYGVDVTIIVESGKINIPEGYFNEKIKLIKFHEMKKKPLSYFMDWLAYRKKCNSFDYIHFHTDNLTKFLPLLLLFNKKNVVIHSHNSTNDKVTNSRVKTILNGLGKRVVKSSRFVNFACSDTAAAWLFDSQPYIQINNGVSVKDFAFDSRLRQKYRKKLQLQDKRVFAHVGRFSRQKNQVRLIKIFKEVHKQAPNTVLLLIGHGDLENQVKQMVNQEGLTNAVKFLGFRDDVKYLMNAVDDIIFPSLYEGLPISLVEAQVNGVPVFYANTITSEVKLLPSSKSFDLKQMDSTIAKMILDNLVEMDTSERTQAQDIVKARGYDDNHTVTQLYDFYSQK